MSKKYFYIVIAIISLLSLIDGFITIGLIDSHGGDIYIEQNPLLLWAMETYKSVYTIIIFKVISILFVVGLLVYDRVEEYSLGVYLVGIGGLLGYISLVSIEISVIIPEHIKHGHPFIFL